MPDKKIIEADDSGPLSLSLKGVMMIASSTFLEVTRTVYNCLSRTLKSTGMKMDAIVHWVHNAAEATHSKIQIVCGCWV